MINLQHRSLQKELLDADGIPFEDIAENMRELDVINRLLGGHAISLRGLAALIEADTTRLTVCEIGSGGGDNLRAISDYCKQKNIQTELIGIDIKKECIDHAKQRNKDMKASWICSDYKLVTFGNALPDIIFSSLFCHHFTKPEIAEMLRWMMANSTKGFFINDLHRHPLAWYSIKWITAIFSRSYLVKNDAPLSVARGFTKAEWKDILKQAGIKQYSIQWKWAFRHLIVVPKTAAAVPGPGLDTIT